MAPTSAELSSGFVTACPECGTAREVSPCHRCGVTYVAQPWQIVMAQMRSRMTGYEIFKDAMTEIDEDKDPIWEYYSMKTWSNLLYWKDKFEVSEKRVKELEAKLGEQSW